MKLFLLGATGRTGAHVLQQALARGHEVHILVRDKQKVVLKSPLLTIFQGNPTDETALAAAITGCEAVLTALNISRTSDFPWAKLRAPKDLMSQTMAKLLVLMAQHSIKRVVVVSAAGANETLNEIPGWFRWMIANSNIRYGYEDHERQEDLVRATDLDWTILRPMGLSNSENAKTVQASFGNNPQPSIMISRKHVAQFLLDALEQGAYIRQAPVISEVK